MILIMLIILIILIAIFLRNVSNDQLRRFLYLLAILYVGTYLYDYYNVKPTNLLDVSINVEPLEPTLIYDKENVKLTVVPLQDLLIWGNKDLQINSDIIYAEANGLVSFTINTNTFKSNIYDEIIYYRFIENGKLLPVQQTYINQINKIHDPDTFTNAAPLANVMAFIKPDMPVNIAANQTIGNVTNEKIDNLTIRRVRVVNVIGDEDALNDVCNTDEPNIDNKPFTRPLEAALDDRSFGTKIQHDMTYENDFGPECLAKFT